MGVGGEYSMNSKLLRHSITAIAHSPQGTRQTLADNSVIRERHGHEIFVCMYMEQRDCKSGGTVIFPFFLQYDLPGHRLAQCDRAAPFLTPPRLFIFCDSRTMQLNQFNQSTYSMTEG